MPFAVALLVAIVDVVVAEAAEIKAAERIVDVTVAGSGGVVKPDRRMFPGQRETKIETDVRFGDGIEVCVADVDVDIPSIAFFMVDRVD